MKPVKGALKLIIGTNKIRIIWASCYCFFYLKKIFFILKKQVTGGYSKCATKHRWRKAAMALPRESSPTMKGSPSTATSKLTRLYYKKL